MIIQKIGFKEIKFYGSIEDLPVERFMQLQAVSLQDAGIGSTLEDYDRHEQQVDLFLSAGRYEDAIKERENKRFNIHTILERINTKSMMLACLCHSIGKDVRLDITEDGLLATSKILNKSGYTQRQLVDLVGELKKKSSLN